jgi:hypothetical protein
MSQKDQQQRLVSGERFNGIAGLRAIGLEELAINVFREGHRYLYLCRF